VGETLKYHGTEAKAAIENLELPVIPKPGHKPMLGVDDAEELDLKIWDKEVDEYMAQSKWLKENMKTTYIITWGQCSDAMRARAEATTDFKATSKSQDTIALLKVIKQVMFCCDKVQFSPHALRNAHRKIEGQMATPNEYLEYFMNCVDVILYSGGKIGLDPNMIKLAEKDIGVEYEKGTDKQKSKIHATAKELYLASCFFLGVTKHRYGRLIESTETNFIQNVNQYSKTISSAHSLLLNYKQYPRNLINMVGGFSNGIEFTTATTEKMKRDKTQVTCHRCGKKGHYANELEKFQEHEKTQVIEVTAMTTHNCEEDVDGYNLNFEFCGCNVEDIDLKLGEDGRYQTVGSFLITSQKSMYSRTILS